MAENNPRIGNKREYVYNWVYQHSRPPKTDKTARTDEHLYDELKQLRNEVARLKDERDLLISKPMTVVHNLRLRKADGFSS